jgi:hypothetical protein
MSGYTVLEELFDKHYRVLRVDYGAERVYSVDLYARLSKPPVCHDTLSLGKVTLCYVKIGLCEALVSIVGDVVELINAKLVVRVDEDPAGGSLAKAREICLAEASKLLGA